MSTATMTPREVRDDVARRVKSAMREQGASARVVAEAVGMSTNTLSRRINARTAFYLPELAAIAAHLDVDLAAFFPDVMVRIER